MNMLHSQALQKTALNHTHIDSKTPCNTGGNHRSDLKDAEWVAISVKMSAPSRLGRRSKTDLRKLVNALLYIASSGGTWRLLLTDFPPFSTAQEYFYRWRDEGMLRTINHSLVMTARLLSASQPSPIAGVIDSQSLKTRESGRIQCFDALKKINRRKRRMVVDTHGLIVGLVVYSAGIEKKDGTPNVLKSILERCPWLRHIFSDGGYAGPKLKGKLKKVGKLTLEIVKRSDHAKGFQLISRPSVV